MPMKKVLTLIGAIGAIVAVYFLARATAGHKPTASMPYELPHLTVVVEGFDLSKQNDRVALAELESSLKTTKFSFNGLSRNFTPAWGDPSEGKGTGAAESDEPVRFLLPPAEGQQRPVAKKLAELTDDEWKTASEYFRIGGWFVPRLLAPDLKSYV